MSVIFAKYYNVTELVKKMIEEEKLRCYKDVMDSLSGVYICSDTNVFWVARINKNLNEEYEEEEGIYLLERNNINNWDVLEKAHEEFKTKMPKHCKKMDMHNAINELSEQTLFEAALLIDDSHGLENWDNNQYDSLEEAIEELADICGIEEFVLDKK